MNIFKKTQSVETNYLKTIYKYMVENNLDHDSLCIEIKNKKCKLSSSIRSYVIARDFLGNKIETNESTENK